MSDILDRLEAETHRSGMWADTCLLLMEAKENIAFLTKALATDLRTRAETAERERDELRTKLATYERFADMAVDDAIKLILRRDEEEGVIVSVNERQMRAALTAARAAGAAEERERCAKIAIEHGAAEWIAAAIRAEQAPP